MIKRYESTYILGATLAEETAQALVAKLEETVRKAGGTVIETEVWGVRKLAYMIKKQTSARYYSIHFTAPGDVIAKLERQYHLEDEVMRWLTLEMDETNFEGRVAMKKRGEEVEARRAAVAKEAASNPQ